MFEIKFLQIEEMIGLLEDEAGNNPEHIKDVELAKKCFQEAKNANDRWGKKLTFARFDTIFSASDELRHIYCKVLPFHYLLIVTTNLRHDMANIDLESVRRHKYLQTIEAVEKYCKECQRGFPCYVAKLRCELEIISRHVSSVRQLFWRKVNLLRTRLSWTAFILSVLLVASILLAPAILRDAELQITRKLMAGFAISGALGGLFSALRSRESLKGDEASYYIQRLLLWLRPIIGASAGVIIGLLSISGVVSLAVISKASGSQGVHLGLAFLAGFSERFFVGQLEQLMNPKDPTTK